MDQSNTPRTGLDAIFDIVGRRTVIAVTKVEIAARAAELLDAILKIDRTQLSPKLLTSQDTWVLRLKRICSGRQTLDSMRATLRAIHRSVSVSVSEFMKMNKEEQRVMAIAQRASMIAKHEVTAKDLVEVLSISKNRFKSAAKRLLKEHTALQEAQKRVKAPKVLPRLQGARGKLMDLLRDVPPPTELYHHRYSA